MQLDTEKTDSKIETGDYQQKWLEESRERQIYKEKKFKKLTIFCFYSNSVYQIINTKRMSDIGYEKLVDENFSKNVFGKNKLQD